jgi:hypothetical protein
MKVALTIEENLRYQSEIVIEQPESMSDQELNSILDKVERLCRDESAKDVAYVLSSKFGIKVHSVSTGFPGSPNDSELEIIDVSNVNEAK